MPRRSLLPFHGDSPLCLLYLRSLLLYQLADAVNRSCIVLTANQVAENLFTLEIHHGGFFNKALDGTKKYKVPKFNKLGGKIWMDGLDPEMMSWVELNNMAYQLGYWELPISYHFKIPGTTTNEGWVELKTDGDVLEMLKLIPKRTMWGKRRKVDVEEFLKKPIDPKWENPLIKQTNLQKERAAYEANLRAKKLWGGPEEEEEVMENVVPINVIEGPKLLVLDDEDEVIVESGVNQEDGVGVKLNVGQVPTQSTFAGLSDIVSDLDIEEDINERQEGEGLSGNTNDCHGHVGLFPNASHRHCVRHLYNNFKAKHPGEGLKQLVWNAARSSTKVWYNKHMDELRELDEEAWTWFQDKNPAQWCRAFFKEDCKCDILLNNLCESFNSAILPARDKPIITMLEKIRMDMMVRNANRRVSYDRWKDFVGPRMKKMIDKIGQRVTCYKAHRSGEFIFQVTGSGDMGSKHAVDLGLHTCTCRRWQISGIPCVHAICAIRFKKQEASLYCDDYLMPNMYKEAYTPIIYPIAGEDDWEVVDYPIAPPPYKKQAGRPKMKRHKEPGENNTAPPAPKEGKLSKKGIKMSCKICGQQGHNKLGCPITKAKKANAGEGTSAGASSKKRNRNTVKRAPAPKATNVMDQVIRSKKTWKKIKQTVETRTANQAGAPSSKTNNQPPTQSSQNLAARDDGNKAPKAMQPSQSSSEWAGL
ncbi:hypothetical protein ACLB2K_007214 [Fragaria x ananassa]